MLLSYRLFPKTGCNECSLFLKTQTILLQVRQQLQVLLKFLKIVVSNFALINFLCRDCQQLELVLFRDLIKCRIQLILSERLLLNRTNVVKEKVLKQLSRMRKFLLVLNLLLLKLLCHLVEYFYDFGNSTLKLPYLYF